VIIAILQSVGLIAPGIIKTWKTLVVIVAIMVSQQLESQQTISLLLKTVKSVIPPLTGLQNPMSIAAQMSRLEGNMILQFALPATAATMKSQHGTRLMALNAPPVMQRIIDRINTKHQVVVLRALQKMQIVVAPVTSRIALITELLTLVGIDKPDWISSAT
jgi:hypothetical protein